MKTLELFAGTGSFSKVMQQEGHSTFKIDFDLSFECDLYTNLLNRDAQKNVLSSLNDYDIVWLSPPCTTFSMSSGNQHWTIDRQPKTQEAIDGYELLKFCEEVANECIRLNKIFFIENPNGRAVWFLPKEWLKRVWYCQYGDTRAKPTNIWTNLDITFKTCKRYTNKQIMGIDPLHCTHHRQPRGYLKKKNLNLLKCGTQGLKNAKERSVIPPDLFLYILEVLKNVR